MRVALTGLTMAEYFRDVKKQNVLLFIDNIFRYVQAGSEISALMGRMPSAVGYQPTLADEVGALQERIASTKDGAITSVQAVYVPADDLTDPAPATTFTHLDAKTVLSRKIVEQGIYLRILSELEEKMQSEGKKVLDGQDAFKLYDTYGFPLDLTKEILEEKGYGIDEDGFHAAMEEQRERARSSREVTNYMGADATVYDEIDPSVTTEFTGYDHLEDTSKVTVLGKVGFGLGQWHHAPLQH